MPEPRNRNIFLVIYALLFAIGTGLLVYRGPDAGAGGWVDQVLWVWGAMAPLAAVSVPGAVILTEIARWIMVLAAWLENRLERSREAYRAKIGEESFAAGFAEGRAKVAEARAEVDREWQSWNERRDAAIARDEPFTEPPPSVSRNGHA